MPSFLEDSIGEQRGGTGRVIAHYRIVRTLGAGGMGEVYLAEDTKLGRAVALKILPPSALGDPGRREAFGREARAVSALSHPNIITIYEIGSDGETDYMATEVVAGETLREIMDARRLGVLDAVTIAIGIAEALEAAHEVGIVHRDIKPENVMVRRDGYVKVLDFGIATLQRRTDPATESPALYGTLPYAAPELIVGGAADARSDLFSLGMVLHEMLAGAVPWERDRVMTAPTDPPPLRRANRGVPEELDRLVARLLSRDRAERHQSAAEVLAGLEQVRRALERRGDAATARASRRVSLAYADPAAESRAPFGGAGLRRVALVALVGLVALAAWIASHRDSARVHESLAVLPFASSTESERFQILADGMTESLIAELSRLPRLRVIARSSVYRHRDSNLDPRRIGRALGADAVLAGSLHAIDGDLVVRAELIDVTAGHRLWGRTYRRPGENLLALDRQIANEIARELQTAIAAGRQTATVPEAHQLYLEGRYHWNKRTREGFTKAIAAFERAVDLDPSFALAHAGLADVYNLLGTYGDRPPADSFPLAKAAALRAVELDPSLAEARTSLAYAIQNYEWDWDAAEREYRHALRLSPSYAIAHHWYGGFLMLMGRFEEAIAHRTIAAKLDPLSPSIQAAIGSPYFLAGRYDRAVEIYQKALAMDSRYARGHFALGWTRLLQGQTEEGIAALERARELSHGSVETSAYLAYAYARAGRRAEAEALLRSLRQEARRRYIDPYELARIEVALGRPENALADLERAYAVRSNLLMNLKVDPSLDPLRREPRFIALMKKMNFQKGDGE